MIFCMLPFHIEMNCLVIYIFIFGMLKGSLGVTVKLLPCDLQVTDLSHKNSLLQNRVKLHTIDSFPGSHIGGSFVRRTTLYVA